MNSFAAMDRPDRVGLGAALGGHAVLLALLVFGLFKAATPMGTDGGGSGDGVAVSIVTEAASAGPAPAPEVMEEAVEVQEQPEIQPDVTVEPTIEPGARPTPLPKPVQKTIPKPAPVTKPVPKQPTKPVKAGTGRGTGSSDFDRDLAKTVGNLGKGSGTTKTKGPGEGSGQGAAVQTASQIRSKANATIAAEVRPLVPGCAPSTSDNSSLFVFVQMNIGQSANLISANVYDVKGVTPGNQAQVEQMKRCVLDSLRKASPYNLDLDQYDTWRNHKVQLKVNFK
jgi:periplasmic protein TonB